MNYVYVYTCSIMYVNHKSYLAEQLWHACSDRFEWVLCIKSIPFWPPKVGAQRYSGTLYVCACVHIDTMGHTLRSHKRMWQKWSYFACTGGSTSLSMISNMKLMSTSRYLISLVRVTPLSGHVLHLLGICVIRMSTLVPICMEVQITRAHTHLVEQVFDASD